MSFQSLNGSFSCRPTRQENANFNKKYKTKKNQIFWKTHRVKQ